jgi:adenosylcobyric acid synthase
MVPTRPAPAGARTAIVRFPALSNGTDFRLLDWADWVASTPDHDYDFVILPGTKSTIADLQWLRQTGLADWVLAQHRRGATLIGICGGFQMLGRSVTDPDRIESDVTSAAGLGVLPYRTVLASRKTTVVRRGVLTSGPAFTGYEIHMGITSADSALPSFARLENGEPEGVRMPGIIGTYLHGVFEEPAVCREIFGVPPVMSSSSHAAYGQLADWFETYARHTAHLGLVS